MTRINDGLQSFTSGLGTARDKLSTVEYTQPVRGNDAQLQAAYEGAWLPKRIVDQFAEDATRKWRAWQADPDQITLLDRTEKRLDLRAKLERCMILARLWGRAHVYIGIDGQEPGEELRPETVGRDRLSRLTVMSRREISDGDIDDDPFSPYYGTPRYYEVTSPSRGMVRIHPSRLVTLYGAERPSDMVFGRNGDSVLTALWQAIVQHDATIANIAGLVFDARVDVITVPGLARLLSDPETEQQILSRFSLMAQMKGNQRITLLNASESPDTPSETWEQKNTGFATLPDIIDRMQQQVSGAAKMPRALLFGTGAGGLGSTGELELSAYYDQIATVQSNEIEPAMIVLDECLIRSALGNRPPELWYQWSSLWQTSDRERAEIGDKIASKWQKLIQSQAIPADVATMAIINDLTESGVGGGIENAYKDWIAAGGTRDREDSEDMINGA